MTDKKNLPVQFVEVPEDHEIYALDYYSEDNDRALINIVPDKIKELLKSEVVQEYLNMDYVRLRKMLKPTVTMNRLRSNFWKEYELAQSNKTIMNMGNVYKGICSRQNFYELLNRETKAAWILSPVADYYTALEESHSYGIDRLREILNMPLYKTKEIKTRTGKIRRESVPDVQMAKLMVDIFKILDERVKGTVAQKIEHSGSVETKQLPPQEVDLSELNMSELNEIIKSAKPDVKIK